MAGITKSETLNRLSEKTGMPKKQVASFLDELAMLAYKEARNGFTFPGVGKLVVDSILGRDYPVVQAVVLLSALSYMVSTLAVDIVYGWLDPRISYSRAR